MFARRSSLASHSHPFSSFLRQCFARGWRRRALCLALICGLVVLPDVGYAVSAATELAVKVAKETVAPMPVAWEWFKRVFRHAAKPQRQESFNDRLAQLAQLQVSPHRFVGYVGQTVSFSALPLNSNGDTIQGLRCDWLSSDTDEVTVDEAGRATLLKPGLVRIIAQAGSITSSIPLLVRPGQRPLQSDADWQTDQISLSDTTTGSTSTAERLLAGLAEKVSPIVHAQGGGSSDLAYDEMWSEPRNLTGTPNNRVTESTRTGTVLPEGSNFNFSTSIFSLGGAASALISRSPTTAASGRAATLKSPSTPSPAGPDPASRSASDASSSTTSVPVASVRPASSC